MPVYATLSIELDFKASITSLTYQVLPFENSAASFAREIGPTFIVIKCVTVEVFGSRKRFRAISPNTPELLA